jgi:cyclic beta-1,2-glucan synthetase
MKKNTAALEDSILSQETPQRGMIFTRDEFSEFARQLAANHSLSNSNDQPNRLTPEFEENVSLINVIHKDMSALAALKEPLTPGSEWLLDNFHLVEEQIRNIRKHLPKGFYRSLPKLTGEGVEGLPRVYDLAKGFIDHSDATVDNEMLAHFVTEYQKVTALTIGELWAIPIMLRLALIKRLRRIVSANLAIIKRHKLAEKILTDSLGAEDTTSTQSLLSFAKSIDSDHIFLAAGAADLLRQMRQRGAQAMLLINWFEERLREVGKDPDQVIRNDQQNQAANQITIGNAVTSLRTLASLDWHLWFERMSPIHSLLCRDPIGVYGQCDFSTRDHYRHHIERIARLAKKSELEVTQKILQLAELNYLKCAPTPQSDLERRKSHIGFFLIDDGRIELEQALGIHLAPSMNFLRWAKKNAFSLYMSSVVFFSLLALSLLAGLLHLHGTPMLLTIAITALLICPVSESVIQIIQWVITKFTHPYILPRFDFDKAAQGVAIPEEFKTLVAINALLHDENGIKKLAETLEVRFLGNQDPQISYAILADLPDSSTETNPQDVHLLQVAQESIQRLNEKYFSGQPERFFWLHRKRIWNAAESKFMGWERKRGKLEELNHLLLGKKETAFIIDPKIRERLKGFRFVLTLDTDSIMPKGSAARLIGALAHPLNRPIVDPQTRTVTKGYGILQPRIGATITSSAASLYSRLFAGHSGLDPYTKEVSDVYQDLFLEGSYYGKGIYDLNAFQETLHNRVPENALLSHDLFEGLFARVALASHIEFFDEYPPRLTVEAKRTHRWVRGDWQLLPWIFTRVPCADGTVTQSPISALGRWKLIDNLRRSLIAPTSIVAFILALIIPKQPDAIIALSALSAMIVPRIIQIIDLLIGYPWLHATRFTFSKMMQEMAAGAVVTLCQICFLAFSAQQMMHAIMVTIWRVYISHKNLLEWQTAAVTEKVLGNGLPVFIREMRYAPVLGFSALILLSSYSLSEIYFWSPFCVAWITSPVLAFWLAKPPHVTGSELSSEDRIYLRGIAFSTWQYFNNLLDSSQNYLIPDNFQTKPKPLIAERTSPTNISLSVMSLIAAYDFGFIPLQQTIQRMGCIFESLFKLERYNGHFLNWYQTRTLASLYPRYISTVDSGNLVAFLVSARSAVKNFQLSSIISHKHVEFISERLRIAKKDLSADAAINTIFNEALTKLSNTPMSIVGFGNTIRTVLALRSSLDEDRRRRALPMETNVLIDHLIGDIDPFTALEDYALAIHAAERLIGSIDPAALNPENDRLIKMRELLGNEPSLFNLAQLFELLPASSEEQLLRTQIAIDLEISIEQVISAIKNCQQTLTQLRMRVAELAREITQIIEETDFSFLYDAEKKLFSIGYNLENARRDPSFYDLLASEARLSSFMAIARGQAPQEHWFLTNRSLTNAAGGMTLLSWSGTMFEYLMPLLVTKNIEGTLLSKSYSAIVKTQRIYASKSGLPVWGISESGFSRINFENDYQYKAFGVPDLGLKRGLSDDLVVSPYSCLLAVSIDPSHVVENLHNLEKLKMRGEYGFFEALDFTSERLSPNESSHIVSSFFAHHQGMSFIALDNFLNDSIFQERFHADPLVKSVELLLHEKFPDRAVPTISRQGEVSRSLDENGELEASSRGELVLTPHTAYPKTRLLSNGRLSAMLDNAGSGYLSYQGDISLTRWREDALINNTGYYIYLRDLDSHQVWSTTYQPTRITPDTYEVIFNPEKVEYRRIDQGILAHTDITVSPEDDVEVRRLQLGNLSNRRRRIEVTSFAEVVLGSRRGDSVHPAFSKMFIESEYLSELQTLLFARRKRSDDDAQLYLMHRMTLPIVWEGTQHESSREHFIGRGRGIANPQALLPGARLSGTSGPVLDPVFSLRTVIELDPGDTHQIGFITGFANSREDALRLSNRYHEINWIQRAFEMSWSQRNIELRQEQTSVAQMHIFEQLGNGLLFSIPSYRASAKNLAKNRLGQSALWRFGISGDLPVVLVQLSDPEHSPLAQELVKAHHYLRNRGLNFDLVLFNEYPGGYMQDFQNDLEMMVRSSNSSILLDKRGGIFIRNPQQVSSDELILLQTVARVVLNGSQGMLRKQLRLDSEKITERPLTKTIPNSLTRKPAPGAAAVRNLTCFNGIGGFDAEGEGYRMLVSSDKLPPLPWSNVVANDHFGFLVTESGGGYTWSENSREYRISPWSNDPVSDRRGEALYIRDTSSGAFWSPTPLPVSGDAEFVVNHGFGYSDFNAVIENIRSTLTISGSRADKVKWLHLELFNESPVERTLELYFLVDWVLGVEREDMFRYVQTGFEQDLKFLHASNYYNMDFPGRFAFMGSSESAVSFTSNRREFIGRNGDYAAPQFFLHEKQGEIGLRHSHQSRLLSNSTGIGNQPCGVLMVHITIPAKERYSTMFYLGEAVSLEAAREAAKRFKLLPTRITELQSLKSHWRKLTNSVQVRTPAPTFDLMLNGWLLYQTLACRIMGRSAFYQSGGAIGFRDQLQDSMALLYSMPEITKRQILLAASRMFPEGDVQHWWHPPIGRGIRTKITDNYLWLPYVISRYIEVTGDSSILEEQVGFIQGPALEQGHMETMFIPTISEEHSSLYDHCLRALKRALMRGPHGLPLMGGGDWNDGMNLIGKDGLGESCWLAWFIIDVLNHFLPHIEAHNDIELSQKYRWFIEELKKSMEEHGWDGEWYRRAFFDDGTPLGSSQNDECRIDSLAQSWGIISGAANKERVEQGYEKAYQMLVREQDNLIALLDPPFNKTALKPGYIKGYLAGIRENGGQYTHAASWMILAAVIRGQGSRALHLFQLINPARITSTAVGCEVYKGEPYVYCGDVYSCAPHQGRAGWSWYTGSSGWLYRIGVESILGLKRGPESFTIDPTIPADWRGFELKFEHLGVNYEAEIRNPQGVEHGVLSVSVDKVLIEGNTITYRKEAHTNVLIEIAMGA